MVISSKVKHDSEEKLLAYYNEESINLYGAFLPFLLNCLHEIKVKRRPILILPIFR